MIMLRKKLLTPFSRNLNATLTTDHMCSSWAKLGHVRGMSRPGDQILTLFSGYGTLTHAIAEYIKARYP
jgi:hypothetical protein